MEYRVVHAPTYQTNPKKKRGCPKGGWPKKVDKGGQEAAGKIADKLEDEFDAEEMDEVAG